MSKFFILFFAGTLIVVFGIAGFILINNSNISISTNLKDSGIPPTLNSTIIFSDDMNGANDTNALKARGYLVYYRGTGPQGTSATWFQGQPSKFPAYNGPQNGYVASDYNVVTGQNNIDCWLVLPKVSGGLIAGDSIYFYSRSEQGNPYADSIRVMYSETDSIPEGVWTEIGRYKAITSGLWEKRGFKAANSNSNGRFAIRYCVVNGGPGGQNSDYIGIDAISIVRNSLPVITHTPITDYPKKLWPPILNCVVSSEIGIDSVWVSWRINNNSISRFNLSHDSANSWSNTFNSDTSQVNEGDSIFYRIIARDISGAKDSSNQYEFKIMSTLEVCIGTGENIVYYPYYTLYPDARTDMLYLKSELNISEGQIIAMAYNIVVSGYPPMQRFFIKMQNTTDTSIYSFTSSGWTEVYTNAGYRPLGFGWQYLKFDVPFTYTGGNILVEVCYNNYLWNHNSQLKASPGFNNVVHQHGDVNDGCNDLTIGGIQTYRPNTCFLINTIISGTGNIVSSIPEKYFLSQNYPNPFNPSTKIKYDLPKKGLVMIRIYDILGREISNLVNEVKAPGSYIVEFDSNNLSSGVYFYKLEVNNFSDMKKMILIR